MVQIRVNRHMIVKILPIIDGSPFDFADGPIDFADGVVLVSHDVTFRAVFKESAGKAQIGQRMQIVRMFMNDMLGSCDHHLGRDDFDRRSGDGNGDAGDRSADRNPWNGSAC